MYVLDMFIQIVFPVKDVTAVWACKKSLIGIIVLRGRRLTGTLISAKTY
jgi:hypothetical protein